MRDAEGDVVDYAHTTAAERNRKVKAQRIAAWCWQRAITAGDLDGCGPVELAAIAGQARVAVPGEGSMTWHLVKVALERMAVWAAAHPGDPRAAQPYAGLGRQWVRAR